MAIEHADDRHEQDHPATRTIYKPRSTGAFKDGKG
uniref:Uncharacterized protein n=1 Tax=Arundo donax TaxID=35708 RepID=A0A0A8YI03_ARUDO